MGTESSASAALPVVVCTTSTLASDPFPRHDDVSTACVCVCQCNARVLVVLWNERGSISCDDCELYENDSCGGRDLPACLLAARYGPHV